MLRETASSTSSAFWRFMSASSLVDQVGVLDRFALDVQGFSRLWVEDLEALPLSRLEAPLLLGDQLGRLLGVCIHSLFHDLFSHAHPERHGDGIRHRHLVQRGCCTGAWASCVASKG